MDSAPRLIPLSLIPLSALFYVILRLAKAGPTFLKVFSVVSWSFVIYRCVGGIFVIAALLLRGAANFAPAPPEAWSPTSLAKSAVTVTATEIAYLALNATGALGGLL